MTIAILAHDSRKELALQFCTAYSAILSRNNVIATGTTGRMLAQATGLPVHCYLSGKLGGVQAASPVDSYAAPEPSPEPGYTDEVVMASGSFTQGSTIELSCDGPLREPYTCYLQGGLNFAASRAGVLLAVQKAYFKE